MRLLLRHPRTWLVLGWLMILVVVALSLMPGQKLPATGLNDKFQHGTAYALLALWFAGIYPRSRYWLIAIGLLLLGVGIEFAQGAMSFGREADLRDVLANGGGIAVGLGLAWLWLGGWAQQVEDWSASLAKLTGAKRRS
ncbi:hypothetical protein ACG33_08890 [Steroidobacter denitrificans]|uniref:VanZ-like domain-containing protein n=1 Tax=Steroidobacter denitrificans TaxID=465721 RepID=A0A127F9W4_STEDE|nr:hypothetical protein [Steroidobacter denitrificans]AMN47207.1 hypothetical protein ACG33_08890 [Steroidobacter denitrificans]